MSSKPTVTLTLAGDEQSLSRTFASASQSAQKMATDVASTAPSFDAVNRSTDEYIDKADGAEQKAIGFTDTLSGMQGIMQGISDDSLSFGERLAVLGQGAADLAGGLANLVIPAVSGLWQKLLATSAAQWTMTAAQTAWTAVTTASTAAMAALNAVMRANPILFIVGLLALLVGGFILLWNKSEGFRNFFIGMWNGIKTVVGNVVQWIKDVWNGIPGFFRGVVDTIGKVFSGIGSAIKNAFKGAINFVIDLLNGAIWALNKVIDGINYVPGVEISHIPKIPRLHTGGVVPGLPGEERLAILAGGERVNTSSQGGGGGVAVGFHGDTDSGFASWFQELVRNGTITLEVA